MKNEKMMIRALSFTAILIAALVAACESGGDDPKTEPGDGYQCVRDSTLILRRTECQRDIHCPCGTHCAGSLCTHECLSDDDCDGWCDYFGHCRPDTERSSIVGVTPSDQQSFAVSVGYIPIYNEDSQPTVRITALAGELANVRLVASPGLEVDCGEGFATECVFPSLRAEDGALEVTLRMEEGVGVSLTKWRLSIYHANQTRHVHLERRPSSRFRDIDPGRYAGQIWISNTRVTVDTDLPATPVTLQTSSKGLSLSFELDVHADGTLVLRDVLGVLPADWTFRLREDGAFDAWANGMDRSLQRYVGELTSVADTELAEVGISAAGSIQSFGGTLQGSLTTVLDGLGLTLGPAVPVDERLRMDWSFTASFIGALPTDAQPPALGGGPDLVFAPATDRFNHPLPWEDALNGCGLPQVGASPSALDQVQGLLCYNHPTDHMDSVTFRSLNSSSDLTAFGDLKCDDPSFRPTALPFFTMADRALSLHANQLLSDCLTELTKAHGPSTFSAAADQDCLDDLTGCGTDDCDAAQMPRCIDAPLALGALGLALEAVERRGYPYDLHWVVADEDRARLALRLIGQWLQLHTFVAREAGQQADRYLGELNAHGLGAALATSLNGWRLVLHPKVMGRLLHLPGSLLAEPDYRGPNAPTDLSQDKTHQVGLPVVILEALRAQVEAANQLVLRLWFEGGSQPDALRQTMQSVGVLHPLALLLHQRATNSVPSLAWAALWDSSREAFDQALSTLQRNWRAYQAGKNPLGISDQDLPLYRGLASPDGPGGRFAAISNHLIGLSREAVDKATLAKTAADEAWLALLVRQVQAPIPPEAVTDRTEEIARNYGEKIINLCGNPFNLMAHEVLDPDKWPNLNPASCFMNQGDPACVFDEQALLDSITAKDVEYHFCVMAEAKRRLQDKATLDNRDVNQLITQLQMDLHDAVPNEPETVTDWFSFIDPAIAEGITTIVEGIKSGGTKINDLMRLQRVSTPTTADEAAFLEARSRCLSIFNPTQTLVQKIADDPAMNLPDCYQGSLGELSLATRGAVNEIETATSQLQDSSETYEAAVWQCTIDDQALQMTQGVSEQLGNLSAEFESMVALTRRTAEYGRFAFDIGASAAKAASGDFYYGIQTAGNAYGHVTGQVANAQESFYGISDIKRLHANFLADVASQVADARCFHDAEMHLIGAETQALRIDKAKLDLAAATLKIRNAQAEVARLIAEGRHRLAGELERMSGEADERRTSLVHDVWQDLYDATSASHKGKVETYRQKMRLGQRMTYLALRALEYELQLPVEDAGQLRDLILAARTPAELDAALVELELVFSTGNIAGQWPENRHVELSLKDHLLQLADRSEQPDGQHRMNAIQRFRKLLTSPRYAVFNSDGSYRGQLIPFAVAPLGVLGLGEVSGIPLLTGSECAESNWSVNLSLQGEDLLESNATYIQVELLQKNTFYSQWCDTPPEGQSVQQASVRPAVNLLKDPVWGGDLGNPGSGSSEYAVALVDAYFNVEWAEFQNEDYTAGNSQELACRSLYGEYALFFSMEKLSINGSSGLHLLNIDDIWIRFDYVSAAKRWQ